MGGFPNMGGFARDYGTWFFFKANYRLDFFTTNLYFMGADYNGAQNGATYTLYVFSIPRILG